MQQPENDEVIFCGRLSWLTFIKVCFLAVVGSSLIVGAVVLFFGLLYSLLAPHLDRPETMGQTLFGVSGILWLYAAIQTLVWALLTGVLGYPLYKGWARIRGGLIHRAYSGTAEDRLAGRRFLRVLFPCLKVVPVTFLLCLVLSIIFLVRQVPVYRSKTGLLLSAPELRAIQSTSYDDFMIIEQQKLTSGLLMSRAKARIQRPAENIARLLVSVSVKPVYKTSILAVTVDALDPILAAEMANALAEEYVAFTAEEDTGGTVRILERAHPADSPITPQKQQTIFLASLIGVVLGLFIALVWAGVKYENTLKNQLE